MTACAAIELSEFVVLCRPSQWREAAIVLSCCRPDRLTPLIVMEPPPITDEDYRKLYEDYVAVRGRRDALIGTKMAREAAGLGAAADLHAATEAAAEALVPFRSWWRHQCALGELLARRAPERAVMLFQPEYGELNLIEAIPVSKIGSSRIPFLPRATARIPIDPTLDGLASRAWAACDRQGRPPEPHGADQDTPLGWFAAFARALHTGRPLASGALVLPDNPATADPTEAVLVEVEPDATGLIGLQYARARRARLVLSPAPDTSAIAAALANIAGRSGAKLFDGVRSWWRSLNESPDIAGPLQAIEDAVNSAVPDFVVSAVGELDLTAFTRAVPYRFLRKCGADWSTKTIGHVAGDPALIVLTELLDPPVTDAVGFTLLFDTGEFATRETSDVRHVLNDRPSIPLLLSDEAAAALNLVRLSELPVEFIHFNTHGNQQGIVLADGDLPAWKLLRNGLRSRPFVFNNSCLSWVGVGRQFVRIGSRGYIGTLWPVDAEQAARLAGTVLERAVRQGWAIAAAIRNTGVDRHTDRAYIFVGTASARLAVLPDNRSRREAVSEAIGRMLGLLARSLGDSRDGPAGRFIAPFQELLWTQADELVAVVDQTWPAPDKDRLEIAVDRLDVLARQAELRRDRDPARTAEARAAQSLLDQAGLAEDDDRHVREALRYAAARIALAESRPRDAIEWLSEAASSDSLCLLSDALRRDERPPEALAAAEKALAAVPHGDGRRRLVALGRVGQLTRICGQAERSLGIAREGMALATELDDIKEGATFKGDETRALLILRRSSEAVAAARAYRDLARQTFSDLEDLAAAGALAQALTMAGDLPEADKVAGHAVVQARASNQPARVAQFLLDRARIAGAESRLADAVAYGLESAAGFAALGAMESVGSALGLTTEFLNMAHRDRMPGWDDLFRTAIDTQRSLSPRLSTPLQSAIAAQTASQMAQLTAAGSGLGPD